MTKYILKVRYLLCVTSVNYYETIGGENMLKLKEYVIASIVSILIAVLVHIAYAVASVMNTFHEIEFYVAFIGGGLTFLIYNTICNRKRTD